MGRAVNLQTNDPEKQLSLHNVRHAGDPNYLVADLRVRSRRQSCDYEFYFDRFHADRLMLDLERMDGGATGDTVLKQEWGTDHLRFQKDALGRVAVSGELVAQGSGHHFAFKIETDQTVLKPLIAEFRQHWLLLSNAGLGREQPLAVSLEAVILGLDPRIRPSGVPSSASRSRSRGRRRGTARLLPLILGSSPRMTAG